jgi:hypothetical protein
MATGQYSDSRFWSTPVASRPSPSSIGMARNSKSVQASKPKTAPVVNNGNLDYTGVTRSGIPERERYVRDQLILNGLPPDPPKGLDVRKNVNMMTPEELADPRYQPLVQNAKAWDLYEQAHDRFASEYVAKFGRTADWGSDASGAVGMISQTAGKLVNPEKPKINAADIAIDAATIGSIAAGGIGGGVVKGAIKGGVALNKAVQAGKIATTAVRAGSEVAGAVAMGQYTKEAFATDAPVWQKALLAGGTAAASLAGLKHTGNLAAETSKLLPENVQTRLAEQTGALTPDAFLPKEKGGQIPPVDFKQKYAGKNLKEIVHSVEGQEDIVKANQAKSVKTGGGITDVNAETDRLVAGGMPRMKAALQARSNFAPENTEQSWIAKVFSPEEFEQQIDLYSVNIKGSGTRLNNYYDAMKGFYKNGSISEKVGDTTRRTLMTEALGPDVMKDFETIKAKIDVNPQLNMFDEATLKEVVTSPQAELTKFPDMRTEEALAKAKDKLANPQKYADELAYEKMITESTGQTKVPTGWEKRAQLEADLAEQVKLGKITPNMAKHVVTAWELKNPLPTTTVLKQRALNVARTTFDIIGLLRFVPTSLDISMMGLQAGMQMTSHPDRWVKMFEAFKGMSLRDPNVALEVQKGFVLGADHTRAWKALQNEAIDPPMLGVKNKLKQSETTTSAFIRKIWFLKQSNDLASLMVLKGMMDDYEALATMAEKAGKMNPQMEKELGALVNAKFGRAPLPKGWGQAGTIVNQILFSPRLQVSTLSLPFKGITLNPIVRAEVARLYATNIAFGTTVLGAYAAAGGEVDLNMNSADFGKITIGSQHISLPGAYIQYLRFGARLWTGGRTSKGGEFIKQPPLETMGGMIQSKLAPTLSLGFDWLQGEDYSGRKMSMKPSEIAYQAQNRLLPFTITGLVQAINQDGILGAVSASPSVLGIGVVTYDDPVAKMAKDLTSQPGQKPYEQMTDYEKTEFAVAHPEFQALQDKTRKEYAESISGKNSTTVRYYAQTKVFEEQRLIKYQQAAAAYKVTKDGPAFRQALADAETGRRTSYDNLNLTPEYQPLVANLARPINELDKTIQPEDFARKMYTQMMFGNDMYPLVNGKPEYNFERADQKKAEFIKTYGQDMMDYVEKMQGVKDAVLPPEALQLKAARKTLAPYWQVEDDLWQGNDPALRTLSDDISQMSQSNDPAAKAMASKLLKANPRIVSIRAMIAKIRLSMQLDPAIRQALIDFY